MQVLTYEAHNVLGVKEDYDDAVESGQSRISRDEAERRYFKKYGRDDRQQNGDY